MKIKTFQNSGHAKQNLQGAYKIMNAPCESSSNSEESVSLVLVFWWMRSSCTVAIRSFFFFLSEVGLRAILESHYSFVFTGSAHRLVKHSDIWSPESTKNVMNITL